MLISVKGRDLNKSLKSYVGKFVFDTFISFQILPLIQELQFNKHSTRLIACSYMLTVLANKFIPILKSCTISTNYFLLAKKKVAFFCTRYIQFSFKNCRQFRPNTKTCCMFLSLKALRPKPTPNTPRKHFAVA